jgi:hypothetical protein
LGVSDLGGGLRGGRRCLRLGLGWGAFGLEALQFLDGLQLRAASVIDAALETGLGGGTVVEGLADGGVRAGVVGVFDLVYQELGIDPVEAAETPGVADNVIDQGALDDGLGLAILVEPFGERGESGGILAGDDARFSVNSGFQGVHAAGSLALDGAWAGGVLRVAAVSFYLTKCSHFFLASFRGQGRLAQNYSGDPDCGCPQAQGKRATWGPRGKLGVSG